MQKTKDEKSSGQVGGQVVEPVAVSGGQGESSGQVGGEAGEPVAAGGTRGESPGRGVLPSREPVTVARGRRKQALRPRAGLVTERDLELVRWTARFPFLTVDLLHQWTVDLAHGGGSVSIVYTRLRVLESAGLIESRRILAEGGRAVWATPEGLRAAGVSYRSLPPRVGTFHHDLAVAQLATRIAVTKPSHTLVTEREMRNFDTATRHQESGDDALYASQKVGTHGLSGRVFPDLVTIAPSGRRVVHEVETSPKEKRRLVDLMLAHLSNEAVGSARYYAGPAVIDRVLAAAAGAREIAVGWRIPTKLSVVALSEALQ